MIKVFKRALLVLFFSISFSGGVFAFVDGLWRIEDHELFLPSFFGLIFFITLNLEFMAKNESLRRWFFPLFVSGSTTLLYLVLHGFYNRSYDLREASVIAQFVGLYLAIFLARIMLKDSHGIKSLSQFLGAEKKGLATLWLFLLGISCLLLIHQISLSKTASSSLSLAEEAYNLAEDFNNNDSEEALSLAKEAQNLAEQALDSANYAESKAAKALDQSEDNESEINSLKIRLRY